MKIFDAHISGSLSVSSSAEIQGDLTVLGTLYATVSGTTTNALTASEAPKYTLTSSFHSFTSSYDIASSSFNTRVGSLESFSSSLDSNFVSEVEFGSHTGSINSFTSSASGRLNSIETSTGSLNTFSSSTIGRLGAIETSTGSLNSFTSSAINRLNLIETATSSLNTFTSSIDTTIKNKLNSENVISGSVQVTLSSTTGYSTFSSSIATTTSNIETRVGSLETASGSIRTDFNSYTSSTNNRLSSIETSTGSLNSFSSSTNNRLSSIETSTSSLNTFSSSTNLRLGSLETASGSIRTDFNSYTSSANGRLSSLETESGSIRTAFNSYTSSNDNFNTTQNGRLTSLEGKTGSYATTGSNSFVGNQTITGSLIVTQDFTVLGSSSLVYVTSSQLAVSSSTISVNVFEPAERFGGLKVYDSGSSTATASFLWDSLHNHWVYQNVSGANYGGGMFIAGPRNTGSLGDEPNLTLYKIPVSQGGDHIGDSNITDNGSKVSINSNTEVTGTFVATGTPLVSGSSQITISSTTGYSTFSSSLATTTSTIEGRVSSLETASGSIRTDFNSYTSSVNGKLSAIETATSSLNSFTSSINTTIKNKLNTENVISSSAQVVAALPSGTVSGSSQVLNGSGIWSGSAQLPAGVVSGSSQVDHNSTTNYNSNQHVDHTAVSITAGSGLSGGGTIAATRTLTLDTGSNHFISGARASISVSDTTGASGIDLTYSIGTGVLSGTLVNSAITIAGNSISLGGSISAATILTSTGVVSGSSQVSFSGLSGVPSGLVSGSSQISFGSISGVPSGLVSGSSQISFGSISGVPSGLVSGSSQISIASTSGFGTYINQAVLTTSQVTFDSVITNNNGNGTNVRLGDDAWIGDINIANTFRVQGVQNAANGYIVFGNGDNTALGRASTGALTYGGNTIWHAGNDGASSGLDADLLDGNHASAFSPVAGSSSITTVGTISSGTWNGSSISTTYTDAKVTSVSAGTGISVNATTGAVTVTNSGVTSLAGTSNQVTVSASTGGVTLSLPQNIHTGASPTFAALTIGKSGTDSTITFPAQTNDPGFIKHYESNNTAVMYFNVSDDTNDEFHFGYSGDASTFRLRADGVVLEGTWQGSSISTSYTDAKVTSVNAGAGISVNATTGAVTVTNTITNLNQLTNGPGYITSESDTLATVTSRGASTNTSLTLNGGITVGAGVATGRSSWGSFTNANIILASSTSDSTGNCGIEFRSGNNYPSDGAAIFFENNTSGGGSERAKLTIRVENDQEDFIELRGGNITLNGNTISGGGQNPVVVFQSGGSTVSSISSSGVYNGNISGNASNITSYTINQSVGTGNSPTFAGLTVNGVGVFSSSNDSQISLRGTDSWAGIEFDDTNSGPDYIWYHGSSQTFAIGGGGSNVGGKKLHVHGGMTVGPNLVSTSTATYGLSVEGEIRVTTADTDVRVNRGRFQVYNNAGNGNLGYRIRTNENGGWRWQFVDGGNGEYFGVDYPSGNCTVAGTLTENSSIRYKKDIETIQYGLDTILKMRGVSYVKKQTNQKEIGLIAEEVAEILPDIILYDSEGKPDSVSYGRITAVLIEAIKDLKKEINELKNNG